MAHPTSPHIPSSGPESRQCSPLSPNNRSHIIPSRLTRSILHPPSSSAGFLTTHISLSVPSSRPSSRPCPTRLPRRVPPRHARHPESRKASKTARPDIPSTTSPPPQKKTKEKQNRGREKKRLLISCAATNAAATRGGGVATCHGGIGARAGGGCEMEGQEGREGKERERGGEGLEGMPLELPVRCGAVRCGAVCLWF